MDKKYYVYCHTNKINGKKYIGITCQKPTKRWCHGNGYRTCEYFHRAIQKYGWENFTHEILYENLTDSEAQEKERMLIEKFNTLVPNGYNLESGGRLNKTISDETRKKLSECRQGEKHPNYGKQMSQEQKDKIAKTLHETHVGWKHKEETKKKMSEVRKGKRLSEETKTKISMANKGCVRSIEYRKHFSEIMSGDKNPSKRMDVRAKIGTSVVQIDPNGMKVVNVFITQRYAEQQTGINRKEIAKCCKGFVEYAGGYIWKFTEEGENDMAEIKPIILTDTETNEKYTLEFSRESVKFAEDRGFAIADLDRYPMTKVPELFYYAFRMHHKNISRQQTDKMLFEQIGGVPDGMLERLAQLYSAPFDVFEKRESKNSTMTVEM